MIHGNLRTPNEYDIYEFINIFDYLVIIIMDSSSQPFQLISQFSLWIPKSNSLGLVHATSV
jgi:hypothetical protein